ncbi:flagellar hook-associated protein FlgL [Pseudoalteromonas sp. MMG010]|uniref:flagellar hook-associated protein FlgL n=1 Tax=Pseudoalteromonas sp. MMG010 TaxID=2822685 RepID=UPI001B3A09C5|nr:flagellar hook-associated protein FlgL [Pseudoalteromonas sp. MMG010]MBQ4831799.1 flagellar hook-associated protein FlgL [Pseudoalteromonas sp. MMG010]
MRLSNNLIYQGSINSILDGQVDVADAQERITSGQQYLSISEAPSEIAQAMLYNDKIETNEQYTKNINLLSGRLETEESILQGINTTIQEAQVLALQAGNGAYTQDDIDSIADELSELQKSLFSLMNTQSEDGKYIFSGYQDTTQTYSYNSLTQEYDYQGDQGQHSIIIAQGVEIDSSDNGFDVFEKVDARLNVSNNNAAVSGSTTSATVYVDEQGTFDSFHEENYNNDPSASATANTYSIVMTAGATADDLPQYEVLRDGVSLSPAVSGEFDGENIEYAGLSITVEGDVPGQLDFELAQPTKENVLNTMQSLISGLYDGSLTDVERQEVLSDAIVQLQSASEQVVFTQASLGGRMNVVDRIEDTNLALDINNQANKASLVEVDMAEAISELTKQETALQAAQATFGRLSSLSLFDYL